MFPPRIRQRPRPFPSLGDFLGSGSAGSDGGARGEGEDGAGSRRAAALAARLLALVRGVGRGGRELGGHWPGVALSRELGEGLEPGGIRPYAPGEDARRIDWRVTARRGDVYLRDFVAERELPVVLALIRSPGLVGGRGGVKGLRACEIVAFLAALATAERCRMGLWLLGAGSRPGPLGLGRGTRHFLGVLEALLEETATWRPPSGFEPVSPLVLGPLGRTLRERCRLFLVGDALLGREAPRRWAQEVGSLARRHRLTVVRVGDPLEGCLPSGTRALLWDPSQGRVQVAGGISWDAGRWEEGGDSRGHTPSRVAHDLWEEAARVSAELRQRGVEVWDLDVQRPLLDELLPRLLGSPAPKRIQRRGEAGGQRPEVGP